MSELSIVNAIEESIGSPEGGPFDYQMGVAMELGLWKRHGEKMFSLEKSLADGLRATEAPSVSFGDIHYPFFSFILLCKDGFFDVVNDYGASTLKAILVNTIESIESPEEGVVIYTEREVTSFRELSDKTKIRLPDLVAKALEKGHLLNLESEIDPEVADEIVEDFGYSIGHRPFMKITGFLFDGNSITASINMSPNITDAIVPAGITGNAADPIDAEDEQAILNIMVNSVLYINTPKEPGDSQNIIKKPMFKREGRKARSFTYLRPPKNYSFKPKTGKKLSKKFLVRGHWRKQRHGKNLSEVKRVWIMPFWKGPENDELSNNTYRID